MSEWALKGRQKILLKKQDLYEKIRYCLLLEGN
jgi:hypothetical protein